MMVLENFCRPRRRRRNSMNIAKRRGAGISAGPAGEYAPNASDMKRDNEVSVMDA